MGRPKIRWEDDVKRNMQRSKVPNWKTPVQDRRRWKEVVEKAETLTLRVVELPPPPTMTTKKKNDTVILSDFNTK